MSDFEVIQGKGVSPGSAEGKPLFVDRDVNPQEDKGIIFSKKANTSLVNLIDSAKAVVTEGGSSLCHLAIICREFEIPCVVNADFKGIGKSKSAKVNGDKGIVKLKKK